MSVVAEAADRAEHVRAFEEARACDDVQAMAAAAVRIAAGRLFGAPPDATGYLHEAYERALAKGQGGHRLGVELAVELARAWAYAGEPERALPFATRAVAEAEKLHDLPLLAAALDADLLTRWGPDQLEARVAATARLDSLAGRLSDVEARLSAALWRLTTALETLDVVSLRRQLRLLDELARDSGSARVAMFAASRRGMYALLAGDVASAKAHAAEVASTGESAAEPDTEALVHVLRSGVARQSGDISTLAQEASSYEAFAAAQGIRSVLAEAALFWLEAGEQERAAELLEQVVAGGIGTIPRDVDWLLTLSCATEVAARVGRVELAADAVDLLWPYSGRGVVNAGGVAFNGVVDDVLRWACTALGRSEDAARFASSAAAGYRRLGARWWADRLATITAGPQPAVEPEVHGAAVLQKVARVVFAPSGADVWLVGPQERPVPVRATRGLRYLRLLLARPGVEVSALELAAAVTGGAPSGVQRDLGATLDRRALAQYRQRLADLDAALAESSAWADQERTAALTAERGFLLDELAAATGLHGRARPTGSDAERARVAVQKAVSAAVRRVADADPATGRLLRDTVRTGRTCWYEPDPQRPVVWVLDVSPAPAP